MAISYIPGGGSRRRGRSASCRSPGPASPVGWWLVFGNHQWQWCRHVWIHVSCTKKDVQHDANLKTDMWHFEHSGTWYGSKSKADRVKLGKSPNTFQEPSPCTWNAWYSLFWDCFGHFPKCLEFWSLERFLRYLWHFTTLRVFTALLRLFLALLPNIL